MSAGSDYQRLRAHLAFLKMTAAAEALPGLLDEAAKTKLSTSALLERLLSVEVDAVDERRRASLTRFAALPSPFTLSDFDFSAQPSVDEKLICELGTLRFIEDATNVLLIGPPGVGKTMLAVGLGHAAATAGMRVHYTTAADLAARCHRAALEGRLLTDAFGDHVDVTQSEHGDGPRPNDRSSPSCGTRRRRDQARHWSAGPKSLSLVLAFATPA